MAYQIQLSPSQRHFSCEADESILQSALDAGFILPYGCKNGACGSCKGKVLSGQVQHGNHQERALSAQEAAEGYALFCCAKPLSDVMIEARESLADDAYPIKKLPTRVMQLQRLSDDVMLVQLQLPTNEKLNYRAGQYIELMLKDGKRRAYSIANQVNDSHSITLHIRHMPGGYFTDHVFHTMKERDILRFEGPQGSFYLRNEDSNPIIFLASGTGFAPIKAIMEELMANQSQRHLHLYWGGRRPHDLYMRELCEQWATQLPHFCFVPVISDAQDEDQWQGRSGLVHHAVMQDFPNLSQHHVYACGAPIMVDSARTDFQQQCHLPKDAFFADAFISEADLIPS